MSPPKTYAELHTHSYFSFLDGRPEPEELIAQAAHYGLSAIALTDHNGLYGIPRFLAAARAQSVAALVGAEISLDSDGVRVGVADPAGNHLVVLASSIEGYRALSRVISVGHRVGGEKGRFVLTADELAQAAPKKGGWIVLTGCRKGPLSRTLMTNGPAAVDHKLAELVEMFGRDRVIVECFDHGDPVDVVRNEVFVAAAVRAGVRVVATQDVHALGPSQQRSAGVVGAVRANLTLAEMDGYLWGAGAPMMLPPRLHFQRFARFPGLVEATVEVARECYFPVSLIAPGLPRSLAPAGASDISWLRRLVFDRAPLRYGEQNAERVPGAYRQLEYELAIVEELGFAGYFLVVSDIVDFCRRHNIYCQGRGSAANSAICYALGITNADPVALGLLFERFLSPERDGPPDIDVDIESGRREEAIQYVYTRYGREHAAQVASVITYRTRSVIRDVARAMGAMPSQVTEWATQMEHRSSLAGSLAVRNHRGEALMTVPEPIVAVAKELENTPRHLGLHVGGMVICDRPVVEVCPTEWARKKDRTVLQWDKDDCAQMGLVKFDMLGLGMLEAIHEMVDLIAVSEGEMLDIALLPQDPRVYEMLAQADSVGVFQVESRAQMATLPRLCPECFYDLVVEVALIRPGPIQGGSVHPYLRRRAGEEEVTYPHPLCERSLAKTLGVPLFQEQLMQLAMDVANFTPAEADELRQAMSAKRSSKRMARLRSRLFAGMRSNGITDAVGEEIFAKLAAFANFGFPESHAASFAYLVYVSAWMKFFHPAAFYAGLLRAQPMGFWSPQTLIQDARRHGVPILPVDVSFSDVEAVTVKEGGTYGVRIGLGSVRGLCRATVESLVAARPFSSVEDLVRRVTLTERELTELVSAGAVSSLLGKESRLAAIWQAGPRVSEGKGLGDRALREVLPLFPELSREQRYELEMSSVGLVYDDHPMALLRRSLTAEGVITAAALLNEKGGGRVRVAGVVTHRQRPGTAKGVVFVNLEDETGLMNVLVRPGVWVRYRKEALSPTLLVSGRIQRAGRVVTVIAERIRSLDGVSARNSRDFR